MKRCERIIGGAGTGKTRLLLDRMSQLRDDRGLSPEQIGFATFTRAARAEMAARAAAVWGCGVETLTKHGHFRTVHSTAMKQLGVSSQQLLARNADSYKWIDSVLNSDLSALDEGDEEGGESASRDREIKTILKTWDYARNTLTPLGHVVERLLDEGQPLPSREAFIDVIERYETAKRLAGRADYSDVLARFSGWEFTLEGASRQETQGDLPDEVRAYFFDECQDSSPLVDSCCRRLGGGAGVEIVVLAGDPYQAIFESFGGGSAALYLSWNAIESTMPQSFRCPANVMELSERCLRAMSQGYRDRGIRPAAHEGTIEQSGDAEEAVLEHADPQRETLILARCNYSLAEYEAILDARMIPFVRSGDGSVVARGLRSLWTLSKGKSILAEDWLDAMRLIAAKDCEGNRLFQEGARAEWEQGRADDFDLMNHRWLREAGCTDVCVSLIRSSRWRDALTPASRRHAESWLELVERWGPDLATEPKIRTSTIHASKGMEADAVILSTQSSRRVERGRVRSLLRHDEECRVLYVAVTRARRKLVIVEDGTRNSLAIPRPYTCLAGSRSESAA